VLRNCIENSVGRAKAAFLTMFSIVISYIETLKIVKVEEMVETTVFIWELTLLAPHINYLKITYFSEINHRND